MSLQAAVDYRERWETLSHTNILPESLGGDAALGKAAAFQAVVHYLPALHQISSTHAERIYAATAAQGEVEAGSYAQQAVAAAAANEQAAQQQQQQKQQQQQQQALASDNLIVHQTVGGPAAAASAFALSACLKVLPPPEQLTAEQARHIESEAMKATGG
jgi:hypothetical protein